MSTYDKASLVLIPSGSKEGVVFSQKPTNGDGDFTFTRASSATRVNSDGLIEKETQNLITYSNDFNGWFYSAGSSATGGQAGYDGTNDAWLLNDSGVAAPTYATYQNFSTTGVMTMSLYAKASSRDVVIFDITGTGGAQAEFNLTSGTLVASSGAIDSHIEAVGATGWYRCSVTCNATSTIYVRIGAAGAGTIYLQDVQVNYGLVATDYIETTTTAVYGGITDNIPRLDYTDASCPSLLLEPQRTNYVRSSEYYDVSSNYILSTGATVEDNFTTSPEGLQNASKVTLPSGTSSYLATVISGYGIVSGDVTISCWAKADSEITIGFNDGNSNPNSINLTTEWQRFEFTFNYTGGGALVQIDNYFGVSPTNQEKVFYLWGLQAEQSSYPTSYIPTYGTSVTFASDACSKTGISDLIGQTEGTIFLDIIGGSNSVNVAFRASDGTNNNRVQFEWSGTSSANFIVSSGGSIQVLITGIVCLQGTRHKIALAYKQNDFVIYIDGSQVGSDTSGIVPTSLTKIEFSEGTVYPYTGDVNQTILFKTRLSNAELAELTTI